MDEFLFFTITKMKNSKTYEIYYQEQFRKCQATEVKRQDEDGNRITIFYSYTCPELVCIKGLWYKFDYEGSRKAGSITGSRTTSKQLTNYYGSGWKDLPKYNLQYFEDEYFYTGIDGLY